MKSKSKNEVIEYEKQHNKVVVKLKKRCEKIVFDNHDTNNNSKRSWSTCKLYFSNKHAKDDADILLIETNKIVIVK